MGENKRNVSVQTKSSGNLPTCSPNFIFMSSNKEAGKQARSRITQTKLHFRLMWLWRKKGSVLSKLSVLALVSMLWSFIWAFLVLRAFFHHLPSLPFMHVNLYQFLHIPRFPSVSLTVVDQVVVFMLNKVTDANIYVLNLKFLCLGHKYQEVLYVGRS